MSTPSTSRLAGAALAGLLGLASTALAGGTVYTTVADGNWADPAVWDLGLPGGGGGDQALVLNQVTVDSVVPGVNVLVAQQNGAELVLETGADLTADSAFLGAPAAVGRIRQLGGAARYTFDLTVGSNASGTYIMQGGSLQTGTLLVGGLGGDPGTVQVTGNAASVTCDTQFHVQSSGTYTVVMDGPGAALTTVQTHDLRFDPGSTLFVLPGYPAEVGDSWDLFHYTGNLVGTPSTIFSQSAYTIDLDTSVPGVVRAVVTASVYPFPGNTCDDAIDVGLDSSTAGNFNNAVNTGPETLCSLTSSVGSEMWYRVENTTGAPACLTAELTNSFNGQPFLEGGIELWDACGGSVLDCAANGSTVEGPAAVGFDLAPGESRLLRVGISASGPIGFRLEVHPDTGSWTDEGGGTAGVAGVPTLVGSGDLCAGGTASIDLTNAPASSFALAWLSLSSTPTPALGGTIYATPFINQFLFPTNASGEISVSTTWPAGVPAGTDFWIQFICQDVTVPAQLTLSNAVRGTTPGG